MGKEFIVTSLEEMCDLMCGKPDREYEEEQREKRKRGRKASMASSDKGRSGKGDTAIQPNVEWKK